MMKSPIRWPRRKGSLRKELAESNTVTKIYDSGGDLKTNNSGEDTITSTITGDASSRARWRPDPPENNPEPVVPKAIEAPRHSNLCYQSLSSHDSTSVVSRTHGSGNKGPETVSLTSVFRTSDHSRFRPDSADNSATFDSTASSEEWSLSCVQKDDGHSSITNSRESNPPAGFNPRKEIRETIKYHHKLGQLLSKLALDPAMSCMEVKGVTFALADSTNNHVNTHPNSEETNEVTKSHRVQWVTSFESANSCDSVIEPMSSMEFTYSNNLVSNFEDIVMRVPSTESGFSNSQCSGQSNRSQKVEQHLSFLESHMTLLGSSDAGTQKRVWPAASPTNDFDADWVSSMPEKNSTSFSNTSFKDSFFPVKGDLKSPSPTFTSSPNEHNAGDNVSSRELSPPRTKVLALASKFSPATPLRTISERSESSEWPTPSIWLNPPSFVDDIESSFVGDIEIDQTVELIDDKFSHEMEAEEMNNSHEFVKDLQQWISRKAELRIDEEMEKSDFVPPLQQPNGPIINETLSNPNMNVEIIIKDLLEKSLVSMEARILKNLTVHIDKGAIQQRLAMEELIREKLSSASMDAKIMKKLTARLDTDTTRQQNAIEDMIEDKVSKAIACANLEMRLAVHDVKTETERICKMVFHDRSRTPPRDRSLPRKDPPMNQTKSISLVIDGRSSRRLSKAGKDKSWIKGNVVEQVSQKSLEDSFTETMKVIDDFVIDCDDIVSDFDKIASRMQDSVASDSSPMSMTSHVVGEECFHDEIETEVQGILNAGQLILSSKLEKITQLKNPTVSVNENTTHVIGDVIQAYRDTEVSANAASSSLPTSEKTTHVAGNIIRAKRDNSWINKVSSQENSAPHMESLSISTLAETSIQQAVIATSMSPSVSVEEAKISQQRVIVAPRGKLGIVVGNTNHNDRVVPAVHTVREGSPLEGLIHVNDVIVAINDVDTSQYTVTQLTKLMAATSEQERRITVQSTAM